MGLNRAHVIQNDALVVLAFDNDDRWHTPFTFRTWAHAKADLKLTMSQCTNMFNRAKGLIVPVGSARMWKLTATGRTYRDHVERMLLDLSGPT